MINSSEYSFSFSDSFSLADLSILGEHTFSSEIKAIRLKSLMFNLVLEEFLKSVSNTFITLNK
ncbi:hypothetical protein BC30102_0392 [Bacillus cereus]|nr:hypothetical protein BC30102_0392 [Bacillus cereus]